MELLQRLRHLVAAHKAFMVRAEELTLELGVLLGFLDARLRHPWYSFGGFHVVTPRKAIPHRFHSPLPKWPCLVDITALGHP